MCFYLSSLGAQTGDGLHRQPDDERRRVPWMGRLGA